jgi:hypothetical protein
MTAPTPPTPALVRAFTVVRAFIVSIPDSEIDDLKQRRGRRQKPAACPLDNWRT